MGRLCSSRRFFSPCEGTAIRSSDSPVPPAGMPTTLMTSSWLFPPRTREVQFDEKWSFVAKKQKNCDPTDPADDQKGDYWDHVASTPSTGWSWRSSPGRGRSRTPRRSSRRPRAAPAAPRHG